MFQGCYMQAGYRPSSLPSVSAPPVMVWDATAAAATLEVLPLRLSLCLTSNPAWWPTPPQPQNIEGGYL